MIGERWEQKLHLKWVEKSTYFLVSYIQFFLKTRLQNGGFMFKKAICFDAWMFPLREEAENLASQREDIRSEILFINCQRFQGKKNLQTMSHFESTSQSKVRKESLETKFVFICFLLNHF